MNIRNLDVVFLFISIRDIHEKIDSDPPPVIYRRSSAIPERVLPFTG